MSDNINKLFASASGTVIAEIITLPICTIKTVFQNNTNYTIYNSINSIYRVNNIKGFFQASTPAILSQVLSTSTKYTIYEYMKKHRKIENSDIMNNIINGMISGLFGSIIAHPFDVWKIQKQKRKLPEVF